MSTADLSGQVAPFIHDINPGRIVFGRGTVARVGEELQRAGVARALVLSTPMQRDVADRLVADLGSLCVGIFDDATMHTPVDVTRRALDTFEALDADCVVSLGGGSTIGLGKAIAYRNDCLQLVVATTYAGSEVTPILGQTDNGVKTTVRAPSILPEIVIYDPELTHTLPVGLSITSGLNAMAHAVEALYAKDRNPVSSLMAVEGIRALRDALPVIVDDPADTGARTTALYGAWLCGSVLGTVGMAMHHKLCHTLGGRFDTPHADTHAILIPHTTAYNEAAAADLLAPAARLFDGPLGLGLYRFARRLGAPLALKDLQLGEDDLGVAADLAVSNPYWNPRPVERDAIHALLQRAWAGEPPDQSG